MVWILGSSTRRSARFFPVSSLAEAGLLLRPPRRTLRTWQRATAHVEEAPLAHREQGLEAVGPGEAAGAQGLVDLGRASQTRGCAAGAPGPGAVVRCALRRCVRGATALD